MRHWLIIAFALSLVGCGDRAIPDDGRPGLYCWVKATGASMLPRFPTESYVQGLIGIPYDALQEGDSVIFWDYRRGPKAFTHHRLVQKQGDSWIAQGDNNSVADRSWVTRDNYYVKTTGVWAKELK